jgi:hypothetical protein
MMGWRLRLACRELRMRRGRSLLALLALTMSVGLVVTTGSIGALMQASAATPAPMVGRPADLWVSSAYDVDMISLPAWRAASKARPVWLLCSLSCAARSAF